MIICGQGRWSENYSSHLEDRVVKQAFGGGHATTRWSLKVLYEENLRHLNVWTWSNRDLELARVPQSDVDRFTDTKTWTS